MLESTRQDRPQRAVRWWQSPVVVGLLLGTVGGGVFGYVAASVRGEGGLSPFAGVGGALLGAVVGLAFVAIGLILSRFVRNPLTGAVVFGIGTMLAGALVGGLFGAVIGLIAGILLGA